MRLYTYWRSSAAYRVRIALNLKGVRYESVPVHLLRGGGEQLTPGYRELNPNATLPALELDDATVITQSLAIVEYLDERFPDPALLPEDPVHRARVRAAALLVACDVHPVNNLRVIRYLQSTLGHGQEEAVAWMRHWMRQGLEAYAQLIGNRGKFSFGDAPTLADLCLIPQLYNARRWDLDLTGLDRLRAIDGACAEIAAFAAAAPERQPDAE